MLDLNTLRLSYERRMLTAERFGERLAEQITELLGRSEISLAVPIEYRAKSWESISNKVERLQLQISDVKDLNDFVGIRVILLFKRDLDSACNLISSTLEILSSEDTLDRLGTTQFGYQSIHFQLKIPDTWNQIPTFSGFDELRAEIQVRTAAQHIWAAASHVLQYKSESAVPDLVLRSINRVSALLETVDLEFERALQEREKYSEITEPVPKNDQLNVDLLRRIFGAMLPAENKAREEDYADILERLLKYHIESVRDVTELIKSKIAEVLSKDRTIAETLRSTGRKGRDGTIGGSVGGINYVGKTDRIDRNVFFTHVGLVSKMIEK